ncbi:hypothetical protein ACFT8W_03640 [Streptomyces hygroscopicus]|uniref:hypothetical protein n=1 Tax=Streptomyces hygroscopicus TaxID=1912 RepID=UPI00362631E1
MMMLARDIIRMSPRGEPERVERAREKVLRRIRKADPACFPGTDADIFFVHGDHTP